MDYEQLGIVVVGALRMAWAATRPANEPLTGLFVKTFDLQQLNTRRS